MLACVRGVRLRARELHACMCEGCVLAVPISNLEAGQILGWDIFLCNAR